MRKITLLFLVSILLSPSARAITPEAAERAQQVNAELRRDVVDQPGDSKKVTRLRNKLRDAYTDYTVTVQKSGNGTDKAHQAAQKVLKAQTALHERLDKEAAKEAAKNATPAPVTESSPSTEPAPASHASAANSDDSINQNLYDDIVKQYGKDSPQAEAARRHFNIQD